MTFGPNHYVPVLKVKRGEKSALKQVDASLKPRITPLLEIVERKDNKTIHAHAKTAFDKLAESVAAYPRCLLDLREIAPDGESAAAMFFDRAVSEGLLFTPVTGISRTADVAAALAHQTNGLALRVTRAEFEAGALAARISTFLTTHAVDPSTVDLIADLGPVEDLIAEGIMALTSAFLAEIPQQTQWRTLTVSGCAFPLSMGVVGKDSNIFVDRAEWVAWKSGLFANRTSLERLPTFSDCAIQHPIGVEGFNPLFMAASAAVRYARPEHWLLIKGVSTKVIPPTDQFPQLAIGLAYGHLKHLFYGASHCAGCASIKASADGVSGYGGPEAWRKIGTVHHLSVAMQEIETLPWP